MIESLVRRIEVSGRLVGQQDRWIRGQGAGNRHALLLAAGKLRRAVIEPAGQADAFSHGMGALGTLVNVPFQVEQRQFDVLTHRGAAG